MYYCAELYSNINNTLRNYQLVIKRYNSSKESSFLFYGDTRIFVKLTSRNY